MSEAETNGVGGRASLMADVILIDTGIIIFSMCIYNAFIWNRFTRLFGHRVMFCRAMSNVIGELESWRAGESVSQ